MNFDSIIRHYDLGEPTDMLPIGKGLIHTTYLLVTVRGKYILQECNNQVFHNIDATTRNISRMTEFLAAKDIDWQIPSLVLNRHGATITMVGDNKYRIFQFLEGAVENIRTLSSVQMGEVARAFGQFIFMMRDFPQDQLHISISNFHNPTIRWNNFIDALVDPVLGVGDHALVKDIYTLQWIKQEVEAIKMPQRIVHSDAKLDNVLFDENGKVTAILDLDTVMPGFVFHDYGDLMRSMVFNRAEDHESISEIEFNRSRYDAIRQGFIAGLNDSLDDASLRALDLGAAYLIFEQCLRFLTDYFRGNVYYRTNFETENLIKAKNQMQNLKVWVSSLLS